MKNIFDKIEKGYSIWHEIKEKYQVDYTNLIIFCEIENKEIIKKTNKMIFEEREKQNSSPIFLISTLETEENNICNIHLNRDEYENLRLYYLSTVFHPLVRFISDKEPFGNLRLYELNENIREDYLRRAVLKL